MRLWLFIATKLMPSQRTNFFVMAQKKNNNKNENVCGQVQKAHKDKSDKGFYFQDFKRLVWGQWIQPEVQSIHQFKLLL